MKTNTSHNQTKSPHRSFITLLAALALSLGASAQTFTNGSFELPGGLAANSGVNLTPGTAELAGWTVGGTEGQFVSYLNGTVPIGGGASYPPPVDGAYHLAFNGGNIAPGAWIAQTFDTVVGDVYEVDFYVGRAGSGAGIVSLDARILTSGGDLVTNRTTVPTANRYGSVQRLAFIAGTTQTTLQFVDTSLATAGVDVLLDAVSVTSLAVRQTIEVSEVAICWIGSTNHMYQLQYRSDLTTNLWVDLGTPLLGTGGEMCVRDSTFRIPRRFYQVLTLP